MDSLISLLGITKTRQVKYIENFTTKKGDFLIKKSDIFIKKSDIFIKKSDIFHISAQNIDCGYS